MARTSAVLLIVCVVVAGGGVAYVLTGPSTPPAAPAPAPKPPEARASRPRVRERTPPAAVEDAAPETPPAEPVVAAPPRLALVTPADETPTDTAAANKATKAKKPKRVPKDPLSRKALVHVGASPVATAYWLTAINNKDLPAEERSDLIEDLNEEGISDPDNPTREDLPLIVSRLELIANYAPFAMDNVNAAAFAEANKDLLIMYNRLMQ